MSSLPPAKKTSANTPDAPAAPPAYLPLARKYRPQSFSALIGQEHITTTLTHALAGGRLAHAYLFAGPRGTGKTSTARIFAKSLNCDEGPTATPCQRCTNCLEITKGSSLDVLEIDGASNRGIDEIRQLREHVRFAPAHGRRKVYIIDEVHQISHDGFNALLKTLEEPPPHVTFIFATTAPQKVPATILSRCQRFDFRRIPAARVVAQLRTIAEAEHINIDEASLFAIARAADGSLRDAESVLDQLASFAQERIRPADVHAVLGLVETDALAAWVDAILNRRLPEALASVDQLLDQGKELEQMTQGLIEYLRHLIVVKACPPSSDAAGARRLIELPEETIRALAAQVAPLALDDLLGLTQVLLITQDRMRRSPLARVVLDVALVHLATREALQPVETLLAHLDALLAQGGTLQPSPRPAVLPSSTSGITRPLASTPVPLPVRSVAPAVALATSVREQPPVALAAAPSPSSAATATAVVDAPPVPALSTDELHALWPRVLERVGRVKMSTAAYLSEGRPLEVREGVLRVALPSSAALHLEILDTLEVRRSIEDILADVLAGARLRLAFVPMAEALPLASARPVSPPPSTEHQALPAPRPHEPVAHQAQRPEIIHTVQQLFDAQLLGDTPATE